MDRRFKKKMEQYWKKEKNKSFREIESLDLDSWFDYWHTHPDWSSKGNRNSEMKFWVDRVTYVLLKLIEEKTKGNHHKLQVWATLCDDTGNNAVYIHSENPNGTPFPEKFDNVEWKEKVPQVKGVINQDTHQVGKTSYGEEIVYYIRKKA